MSEKYALIGAEKADPTSAFTVTLMCQLLEVSSSGFYDWCAAPLSDRARRRATIATHVQAAFTAGRGSYGVRRVRQVLARSSGPQIASLSLKMVRSVMQELDLYACQRRAYKVTTVCVNSVTIMAYRNTASGPDGTLALADATLVAAQAAGKQAHVGQETNNLNPPAPWPADPSLTKQPFYGMTATAMEAVLGPLNTALTTAHPNFDGLCIQDYNGWQAISPGPAIAAL